MSSTDSSTQSRLRPLVVGERTRYCDESLFERPPRQDRLGLWRDQKAFEIHCALRSVSTAGHAVDVQLAVLLRLMVEQSGYRRWGHDSFGDYVTQELRQRSARRFRYLVAIDRAIVTHHLPKLGRAWRSGDVTVSRARELIRVMTADTQDKWLDTAASCSVWLLQRRVRDALRRGAGAGDGQESPAAATGQEDDSPETWRKKSFAATRPVDAAWQVCLETSRRMAGFDLPAHECVDDLLAEYASGAPVAPSDMPVASDSGDDDRDEGDVGGAKVNRQGDGPAEASDDAWRRAARIDAEAREALRGLGTVLGGARLAADPLEGLGETGRPGGVDVPGALPSSRAPRPDPAVLHRRIRWLLRLEANVAWHHCRLLRVVAELKLHQRLGFRSLRQYATEALGSGDRQPWSLVRLARELDRFPRVAATFRDGLVTALEAAEICSVARGGTQAAWVDRARASTLREFREEVAFVLAVEDPSGLPPRRPLPDGQQPCAETPARREWMSGSVCPGSRGWWAPRVQTCATRTSDSIMVPGSRRVEGWYSAFGDDPQGVAAGMLSRDGPRRPVMFLAPQVISRQWDLTLAHCRRAAGAPMALDDSQCVAILLLGFLEQWARPEIIKTSRRHRILTRDGWRCQAPRCRSRAHLHTHHIVYRSRNGPDSEFNLVTVCRAHHRMIHAGVIRLRGRAPDRLEWSMGVNLAGDVRERFINGTRVACLPRWSAAGAAAATRSAADWRRRLSARIPASAAGEGLPR